MPNYVIGTPGEPIRMAVRASDAGNAALQLGAGEVYVEVTEIAHGSISVDGRTFVVGGPDLDFEQTRIRATRTARLSACDWTQVLDAAITPDERQAWADYRQALRDLPADQNCLMYDEVVWPEPPA